MAGQPERDVAGLRPERDANAIVDSLSDAARDLQIVADRHTPLLRDHGLDEIAEQLEGLLAQILAGMQELQAASQPL